MIPHPLRISPPVEAAVAGAVFQIHRLGQQGLFPTRPAAEAAVAALPEEQRPSGDGWFEQALETLTGPRGLLEAVPAEEASVDPDAGHHAVTPEPFEYLVYAARPPLVPGLWNMLVSADRNPERLSRLARQAVKRPYHLWRPAAEILARPEVLAFDSRNGKSLLRLLDQVSGSDLDVAAAGHIVRHARVEEPDDWLPLLPRLRISGAHMELERLAREIAGAVSLERDTSATVKDLVRHGQTEALLVLAERILARPPALERRAGHLRRMTDLLRSVPPATAHTIAGHCVSRTDPDDPEAVARLCEHLGEARSWQVRELVMTALARFDPTRPADHHALLWALDFVGAEEERDALLRQLAFFVPADGSAKELLRLLHERGMNTGHALLSSRVLQEPFGDAAQAIAALRCLRLAGRRTDFRALARFLALRAVPFDLDQLTEFVSELRRSETDDLNSEYAAVRSVLSRGDTLGPLHGPAWQGPVEAAVISWALDELRPERTGSALRFAETLAPKRQYRALGTLVDRMLPKVPLTDLAWTCMLLRSTHRLRRRDDLAALADRMAYEYPITESLHLTSDLSVRPRRSTEHGCTLMGWLDEVGHGWVNTVLARRYAERPEQADLRSLHALLRHLHTPHRRADWDREGFTEVVDRLGRSLPLRTTDPGRRKDTTEILELLARFKQHPALATLASRALDSGSADSEPSDSGHVWWLFLWACQEKPEREPEPRPAPRHGLSLRRTSDRPHARATRPAVPWRPHEFGDEYAPRLARRWAACAPLSPGSDEVDLAEACWKLHRLGHQDAVEILADRVTEELRSLPEDDARARALARAVVRGGAADQEGFLREIAHPAAAQRRMADDIRRRDQLRQLRVKAPAPPRYGRDPDGRPAAPWAWQDVRPGRH